MEQEKILRFMTEAGRPFSFKELTGSFEVKREKRDEFKRLLKDLVKEGALVKIRGGRYGIPSKMNLVTGELIVHPDGFGFVRPEGEGEDVFINPRRLNSAMHGDTVIARVEGFKGGGKREGRIIRVLKRAHKTMVGRFETSKGYGVVIPSDERILYEVIIPPGDAKNAKPGMIVEAEITRWPAERLSPAGRVVEILGDSEDPDVEAQVILKKFGLPGRFPPQVMHEVKSIPLSVSKEDIHGRVDLRDSKTITIDGETAKDFDDAVSIEKTEHGFKLWVSIADVSHYVKEGTLVDAEAYARSTSVYFPDRCIPMLPEALSNGICSLNPNEDRLTITAELSFDEKGDAVRKKFYKSVIRSVERMTYTNVKKILLNEDAALSARYSRIAEDLRIMETLAGKMRAARMNSGSIDFDLPEPQIIIDIEGNIEDIVRSERNVAHRIIEEFMLAANKAVAGEFSSRNLPFLYRVHEEPDPESVEEFREFIYGFGLHFKPGVSPLHFRSLPSLQQSSYDISQE